MEGFRYGKHKFPFILCEAPVARSHPAVVALTGVAPDGYDCGVVPEDASFYYVIVKDGVRDNMLTKDQFAVGVTGLLPFLYDVIPVPGGQGFIGLDAVFLKAFPEL